MTRYWRERWLLKEAERHARWGEMEKAYNLLFAVIDSAVREPDGQAIKKPKAKGKNGRSDKQR